MRPRFSGLLAAVHTPLRPDGGLNLDLIGDVVDHHLRQGLSGIMPCGTTGEGPLLTTEERRSVAAAYVEAARGRLPVIVHVGHSSVREARELAAHAQRVGAQAVAALSPWYVKPATVEGLVESCAEIAAGAPELPFYYYHIPSMTGVALPMTQFLEQAGRRIPTLAGIKYTAPTVHEFQACAALEEGRWETLFGVDEMLLSGLAAGATAAIGSTYNFAAPLYRRLWDAFGRGDLDEARACQQRSIEMVEVIFKHGNQPAIKAIMKLVGLDCGPSRLPYASLSAGEVVELERDLRAIGFFEWARIEAMRLWPAS